MATDDTYDIGAIFQDGTRIDQAMEAADREAIKQHIQAGLPMPVWRDGETVYLSSEELKTLLNTKSSSL